MKSLDRQVRQKYSDPVKDEYYQRLYEIIKTRHLKTGNFILSNGKQSDWYLDIKSAYTDLEFITKANHLLHYEIMEGYSINQQEPFNSIGGLESGALPILTSLATRYNWNYFWVRKAQKEYGLKEMQVIGEPKPPVVIVEDVLNSGAGINRVANLVGIENVMGIACICNRYEFGDRVSLSAARGYDTQVVDVRALFKLEDFVGEQ